MYETQILDYYVFVGVQDLSLFLDEINWPTTGNYILLIGKEDKF